MLIALKKKKFIALFIIIFGTLSFRTTTRLLPAFQRFGTNATTAVKETDERDVKLSYVDCMPARTELKVAMLA